MKLYRFMAKNEFEKLINGEKLKNNKKHQGYTNSVGFCFMDYDDDKPEEAYEYLSGIISEDVCVVFETDVKLKKGYGIYADPYGHFFDTIAKTEYSIKEYSLENFKIIKIAIPKLYKELDGEYAYYNKWKWTKSVKSVMKKLKEIENQELEEKKLQEEISEKNEEIVTNKNQELFEFLRETNEVEFKIANRFYKVNVIINELQIGKNPYGVSQRKLNVDIYL